jgi:hypothetical protein
MAKRLGFYGFYHICDGRFVGTGESSNLSGWVDPYNSPTTHDDRSNALPGHFADDGMTLAWIGLNSTGLDWFGVRAEVWLVGGICWLGACTDGCM